MFPWSKTSSICLPLHSYLLQGILFDFSHAIIGIDAADLHAFCKADPQRSYSYFYCHGAIESCRQQLASLEESVCRLNYGVLKIEIDPESGVEDAGVIEKIVEEVFAPNANLKVGLAINAALHEGEFGCHLLFGQVSYNPLKRKQS